MAAIILTGRDVKLPFISPFTCGIPEPEAIGSHLFIIETAKPITASKTNQRTIKTALPFTFSITLISPDSANESAYLYSTEISPAATPTSSPLTIG
ncbi:MAG: hypothetical protein LUG95_06760 [Clostridiales bacterium]|nr:hypothetical protein [Clostridiales bacterium]